MTEINAEKNGGQSVKREAKSRILCPFTSTISPFRVHFSHMRTEAKTDVRGKEFEK